MHEALPSGAGRWHRVIGCEVTHQQAVSELGLKTCLCTARSGIACHVVTLPHSVLPTAVWEERKNQGLALCCSGVTAPGVDNNAVILLSVAASLTLTDHFSSSPVYDSILSGRSAERCTFFLRSVWLSSERTSERKPPKKKEHSHCIAC